MTVRKSVNWLLILLLVVGLLFLSSSAGFKWVFHKWIEPQLAPLEIKGLEGSWWGSLRAEKITFITDSQNLLLKEAVIDWSPWALLSGTVDINNIDILKINYHSEPSSSKPTRTSIQALPISLNINRVFIKQLELTDSGTQNLIINDIFLSAKSRGEHVTIDNFSGNMSDIQYSLEGTIDLTEQLDMQLAAQWSTTRDGRDFGARLTVTGHRDELLVSHQLNQPAEVLATVTLYDWLDELHWQGNIKARNLSSQTIPGYKIPLTGDISIQASGDINKAKGIVTMQAYSEDFGPIELSSELIASKQQIRWDELILMSKEGEAKISSRGLLAIKDDYLVDVDIEWENLNYIKDGQSLLKSNKGTAKLAGNLDDLSWTANFNTSADSIPDANWKTDGRYEHGKKILILKDLLINSLKGSLQAKGELSLTDNLAWSLTYNANNIDPSQYWVAWPGNVKFRGKANGMLNQPLNAALYLEDLSGELRHKPINASARMILLGEKIKDADLSLQAGRAKLTISGHYDDKPEFKWSLNAPAMEDLIPGAKGQMKLDGSISGELLEPSLTIKGFARSLIVADIRADDIQVNVQMPIDSQKKGDINIQAKNLAWKEQNWSSISLRVNGDYQKHQLKLDGRQENKQFSTEIEGSWNKESWVARLTSMSFLQKNMYPLKLISPAKITVAPNRFILTSSCLSNQFESACIEIDYNGSSNHYGSILVKNLSLDHLNAWIPSHVRVMGSLEGDMKWHFKGNKWQKFNSNIVISPGIVSLPDDESSIEKSNLSWRFAGGNIRGKILKSNLRFDWSLTQTNDTGLSGHLALPIDSLMERGASSQVDASLKANIEDLTIIEAFFPDIYQLQGKIVADLAVSGSWNNPLITGQAGIQNTQLKWPQLGLEITELDFNIQPVARRLYTLTANARSGKGMLKAEGKLQWPVKNGFKLTTQLTGENFKAVNIPDAQIWINPKINIEIIPKQVTLNGAMHIPKAFIQPKEIKQTVSISKDAVVKKQKQKKQPAWQVNSQVKLSLGSEVLFDGFGLKSRIEGELQITDTPQSVTLAQGKLSILKGSYKAYGQELSIDRGDLNYTNNPIDNPSLDIRASRTINEIVAGVHISGLAQKPQLSLYSKPVMTDADILSYLTIGRPLQQLNENEGQQVANMAATSAGLAGGEYLANWISQQLGFKRLEFSTETREQQPWVRVGAYLSPRLYISYGTGLFNVASSLNIRYKLNSKWTLQGESGVNSSGDLLYIIE